MRSRMFTAAMLLVSTAALAFLAAPTPCWAQSGDARTFPFVLPWDDASSGVTNVSNLIDRPAGRLGPVVVRDGHLYTGPKRLRLVGVNLCFGANFPTHDAAEKIAARMARFGINAVRFHHMDTASAPRGIWASDGRTLDPAQLDRLDYLFSQLKTQGIYADLNLHVSRTYPDRPKWEGMPSYHKGVDNFDPEMIRLQRQYARDLLTHVNPYTRTRYADDPAVAIVEINNENALTHEWFSGKLDDMPSDYADTLSSRWNDFLKRKYQNDAALRAAWGAKSVPLGAELLRNGDFAGGLLDWVVERIEGAEADASVVQAPEGGRALRVSVPRPAQQAWHVQVDQGRFPVEADTPYTLSFRAWADQPRKLQLNLMQAHAPWQHLWSSEVALTDRPQTFRLIFQPPKGDAQARVTFTGLADRAGQVNLADVSFRPGGTVGIEPGEALGSIAWFRKADFSRRTAEAQRDWLRFLSEVETEYWGGMAQFLRDELKVKAPIVGTQMNWSPPAVQVGAGLDAIDSHSYWQHPHFPGRPWDSEDWTINNIPMAGRPDGGTLPALGLSRLAGEPFLCTEYNHSAPNSFASETAPLIFSYAAWQDWDGVFLFAYSHRTGDWDTGAITSFFDIDQHPTKMATLPASAALFLRGDVPTAAPAVATITPEQFLEAMRTRGPWGVVDALGLSRDEALSRPVARRIGDRSSVERPAERAEQASPWSWRQVDGQGVMSLDTPRSKVLATAAVPGSFDLGGVTIAPSTGVQPWAVFTLTALDGADFRSPGRVLLTATGLAENEGMQWKDESHTSVGRQWGHRPSMVEGISARVTLPVAASRLSAWTLDERGQRKQKVPIEGDARGTLVLDPALRTLWYEVEIRP